MCVCAHTPLNIHYIGTYIQIHMQVFIYIVYSRYIYACISYKVMPDNFDFFLLNEVTREYPLESEHC